MNPGTRDLREAAGGPLAMRLSPRYLEEHCLIPLAVDSEGTLEIASGKNAETSVRDELARVFQRQLRFVEVQAGEVLAAIMSAKRQPEIAPPRNGAPSPDALDDLEALANQAPVIKLVNVLLLDALRMGASDIHVESLADGVRVRYRLDGVLQEVSKLADQYRAAVISRIKIMSGLDIAERRMPQDGRARLKLADRDVDVRVSTLPALHGESVVLRILDHAGHGRGLTELGMSESVRAQFETLITRTSGIVLVTGPTGSGKTTTLYAALSRVNTPGVKIVTVEDPVEYQIPGVIQLPVNPKAGFNFDGALRSILRHDPDVIMVGEMRDKVTAELAIQAALTGHLVFSTLHTTDAASAITRLVEMGIEPYLVAATVQGIVAQRLLRTLCENCAEGPAEDKRSVGCEACSRTGYRGRIGIYEYLRVTDEQRAIVTSGGTLAQLRASAKNDGMETLPEAGWAAVRSGATSSAELMRVINQGEAA
ncbi:MAG: GspE/PulE family protein [Gemmatimonadales bacterium]